MLLHVSQRITQLVKIPILLVVYVNGGLNTRREDLSEQLLYLSYACPRFAA